MLFLYKHGCRSHSEILFPKGVQGTGGMYDDMIFPLAGLGTEFEDFCGGSVVIDNGHACCRFLFGVQSYELNLI
jgi:hypothetical protein